MVLEIITSETLALAGGLFLEEKGNLQKLKGWFEKAKTNGSVPTSDHGEIDKTIEVIDKQLAK